jgi:hypothetical protein
MGWVLLLVAFEQKETGRGRKWRKLALSKLVKVEIILEEELNLGKIDFAEESRETIGNNTV